MRTRIRYLLLFLAVILIVFSLAILFLIYMNTEKKVFDSYVIIGKNPGFEVNDTAIVFGRITVPGSAMKSLVVDNKYDEKVYVKIYAKGDIKQFFQGSEFMLEPFETRKVDVSVIVGENDKNIEFKKYEGKVIVLMKRAVF